MPLILSEVLVVNNQQATDSVTLRYTPTPQQSSHFDLYRFSLSDPTIPVKEKLANDTEWKVSQSSYQPKSFFYSNKPKITYVIAENILIKVFSPSFYRRMSSNLIVQVTFNNLVPGRLYNITMWTVADKVASQPLQRQDRLYPEPITWINATEKTDTTITLTWDTPRGEHNAYEVCVVEYPGCL